MKRALLAVLLMFSACGGSTEPGGDAGTVSYDRCAANADCVVLPASCCGQCGAATRTDAVALNKTQASAYRSATCGTTVGCPACYMAQDPRLIATCNQGQCQIVDLSLHSSTACTSATDCRLRTNECCECGGATDMEHLIAISSEADFTPLRCDAQGCPECAPVLPSGVDPLCIDSHCQAVWRR